LSVEELRGRAPEEIRAHTEAKYSSPMSFVSEFPLIGRGNVLRDCLVGTEQINKEVDEILFK